MNGIGREAKTGHAKRSWDGEHLNYMCEDMVKVCVPHRTYKKYNYDELDQYLWPKPVPLRYYPRYDTLPQCGLVRRREAKD